MASAQLFLNGARVNRDFREALFDAANRAGVTPNEFCITAAATPSTCSTGRSRPCRPAPRPASGIEGSAMIATAHLDERTYGAQTIRGRSPLRNGFERVWPVLAKAAASYGFTHRKHHVWERIETGEAQLWTISDSAVVTTIERFPTGLRECHFWLAGGDLDEVLSLRPRIEAWAIEKGCDRVVVIGRPGWKRFLPSYKPLTAAYGKDLH